MKKLVVAVMVALMVTMSGCARLERRYDTPTLDREVAYRQRGEMTISWDNMNSQNRISISLKSWEC